MQTIGLRILKGLEANITIGLKFSIDNLILRIKVVKTMKISLA